jgi:hypothetical protein
LSNLLSLYLLSLHFLFILFKLAEFIKYNQVNDPSLNFFMLFRELLHRLNIFFYI